jgi:hypothetical protein
MSNTDIVLMDLLVLVISGVVIGFTFLACSWGERVWRRVRSGHHGVQG